MFSLGGIRDEPEPLHIRELDVGPAKRIVRPPKKVVGSISPSVTNRLCWPDRPVSTWVGSKQPEPSPYRKTTWEVTCRDGSFEGQ